MLNEFIGVPPKSLSKLKKKFSKEYSINLKPLGIFFFSGMIIFSLIGIIGLFIHLKILSIIGIIGLCFVQFITIGVVIVKEFKRVKGI